MKKQLFSLVAALTFGTTVAQTAASSWTTIQNTSFSITSAGVRYMDAVDQNVVWLTGLDGAAPSRNYNFFSRTTDGGNTYNSGNIFADTITYSLANIHGMDANTAWVSAFKKATNNQGVIYKTTDGGTTWANMTPAGMFTATTAFADVVTFFPGTSNGLVIGDPVNSEFELWTTSNNGSSWTPVPGASIPNPLAAEYAIVNLFDQQGTSNLWFGTNKGRIYYTNDAGSTWNVTALTAPTNATVTEIAFCNATDGLAQVAVGPSGSAVTQLYSTSDGGVTWTQITTLDADMGFNDMCGIPGTNYFASAGASTGNFVISYTMDHGLTWTNWGGGIGQQQYLTVDFVDANTGWAGIFSDVTTASIGGMAKYDGVTADFTTPLNLCLTANTVSCTATNVSFGVAPLSYSWTVPGNVVISSNTSPTPVFTFSVNGNYTLTLVVTNSLGATSTETAVVHVLTCSTPSPNFNIPTTVCNNVPFTLTNASSGVPAPSFTISTSATSNVTITSASGPSTVSIRFGTPGVYSITSTASNSFGSASITKTINISNCAPIAAFNFTSTSIVCINGATNPTVLAQNTSTAAAGVTYSWTCLPSPYAFLNSGTSRKYTFAQAGDYVVTLTATNPSGTSSVTNTISVTNCYVGIAENSNPLSSLSVYPNPTHDQLNIVLPSTSDMYKVRIVNIVGVVIYEEKIMRSANGILSVNLSNKPKGVYFLSVENGTDKGVKKIVVE